MIYCQALSPARPDEIGFIAPLAMENDRFKLFHGDPSGLDEGRLTFRQGSACDTGLADGEADIVLSDSFFEHVDDAEQAVGELARITKSGGLGTHSIDGSDHRHYADQSLHPLEFLTIDTEEALVYRCNRIRPLQYAEIFGRHGFEVVEVTPRRRLPLTSEFLGKVVEPYRSMPSETLEVVGALVHTRKR